MLYIEVCFVGALLVLFIFYGISSKPADPILPVTCSENNTNSESPIPATNFLPPTPAAKALQPAKKIEKEMRSLPQSAYITDHLPVDNYDEASTDYVLYSGRRRSNAQILKI